MEQFTVKIIPRLFELQKIYIRYGSFALGSHISQPRGVVVSIRDSGSLDSSSNLLGAIFFLKTIISPKYRNRSDPSHSTYFSGSIDITSKPKILNQNTI